jgi:hypothetical protein
MRKALLAAVASACLGAFSYPTEAAPLGNPNALSDAVAGLSTIDTVHCRPGWAHHYPSRWRRADGCVRRRVVVGPGYYYGGPGYYYGGYGGPGSYYYGYGPGYYGYGPGYYGYGPGFYGPGISVGFGFGPRRWRW